MSEVFGCFTRRRARMQPTISLMDFWAIGSVNADRHLVLAALHRYRSRPIPFQGLRHSAFPGKWDKSSLAFTSEGCVVAPGYTPEAVTCECTHFASTSFALGANTTQPRLSARTTGQPTLVPVPRPSARPTHAPTSEPTTSPPTSAPTSTDTVSIGVRFLITANASPTLVGKLSLKTTISSVLGIEDSAVKALSIQTTTTEGFRRQLLPANDAFRFARSLGASFSWGVSFDILISLSSTLEVSSESFVARVLSDLGSALFASAVTTAIPSVRSVLDVIASSNTQRPTMQPSAKPSAIRSSVTAVPTQQGTLLPVQSATASTSSIVLVTALLGSLVVGTVSGVVLYRRKRAFQAKQRKVAPIDKSQPLKVVNAAEPAPEGSVFLRGLFQGGTRGQIAEKLPEPAGHIPNKSTSTV